MKRLLAAEVIRSLLGLRRHGWDPSIWRIDHQRGSPALDHARTAVEPGVVVSAAGKVAIARAFQAIHIVSLNALLFEGRRLVFREELLVPNSEGRWNGVKVALVQVPCRSRCPRMGATSVTPIKDASANILIDTNQLLSTARCMVPDATRKHPQSS